MSMQTSLVLEQQLWHLGCKLWEELAVYPNAMTLGLSETLKQIHRGVYMLIAGRLGLETKLTRICVLLTQDCPLLPLHT